jgi:hypothetical protein
MTWRDIALMAAVVVALEAATLWIGMTGIGNGAIW